MKNKNTTATQHQKRINIIEILYQYFLQQLKKSEFEEYLKEMKNNDNSSQISTVKDIFWYEENLIIEIEKHLKNNWSFNSLKPTEKAILFLATYEILYTNTDKAIIINESVVLAKQYCDNNAYKYINGVLDKINK